VKPEICTKFGFKDEAFVAELQVSFLKPNKLKKYKELPRFPTVLRDVALTLDSTIEAGRVEQCMIDCGGALLQGVELFDVYEGENLAKGKRSLAFTLVLRSHEKTLMDDEIDSQVQHIVKKVQQEFNAELRHN
jgi:phenylalanyl-tRNA synthetase beta chain